MTADTRSLPRSPARSSGTLEVSAAAQLACLLEASAPKPGNVSPGRHFADVRYEHFLASAVAIGAPLAGAGEQPLGVTIRRAVEATARWVPSNTNLGIVLLLAPLAKAAALEARSVRLQPDETPPRRVPLQPDDLRARVRDVLEATSVDDARNTYAAIRLANPGGLGRAEAEDVAEEPRQTLLAVMRLAATRDAIAREYATVFERTFEVGVPALARARRDGLSWDDAVVETFVTLLADALDTHIGRRAGAERAEAVARLARDVLAAGGVRSAEGRRALAAMDASLRDAHNSANPGATADLTAAAIFVVLLGGGWQPPA